MYVVGSNITLNIIRAVNAAPKTLTTSIVETPSGITAINPLATIAPTATTTGSISGPLGVFTEIGNYKVSLYSGSGNLLTLHHTFILTVVASDTQYTSTINI